MAASTRAREADLAARWRAGTWQGATLRTERGETYRVVFEGRRGGGADPDFRDAVLVRGDGAELYGDIELQLRPTGWRAHGHASDPRYNGLALHVVLSRGVRDHEETSLASGRPVPLVVLAEIAPIPAENALPRWPCAGCASGEGARALASLLHAAGMARFAEHAARLEQEVRATSSASGGGWDGPNRALWLALAEALGYERDRALLRWVAHTLLEAPTATADDGSLDVSLAGVECVRARGLLAWHARWNVSEHAGPWAALEPVIRAGQPRIAVRALSQALRVAEHGAVSPGRAAIVAVNVALPFAVALATLRNDETLAERAREIIRRGRACSPTRLSVKWRARWDCRGSRGTRWPSRGCTISGSRSAARSAATAALQRRNCPHLIDSG